MLESTAKKANWRRMEEERGTKEKVKMKWAESVAQGNKKKKEGE